MKVRSAFLILLGVVSVLAQDGRLTEVRGEVSDMLGKPIANASITYKDPENGRTYHFLTDGYGKFRAVGVIRGTYDIEIIDPRGELIFRARKYVYPEDRALNVIKVDLSIVPPTSSLVPFKGPKAAAIQGEKWREGSASGGKLTPEQIGELRAENAAIAKYNEVAPQARNAVKAQDWTQASAVLQQMIALAPYQWQLYQNLAMVQRSLQQNQESIRNLQRGIEVMAYDEDLKKNRDRFNSITAKMLVLQGESYHSLGNPGLAAISYRKATEVDPKPSFPYILLCLAEYHNANYDAATQACERGITADPDQVEFYQILGGIQANLEKFPAAIQTYQRGIRVAEKEMHAKAVDVEVTVKHDPASMAAGHIVAMEDATLIKNRAGQMLLAEGNAYFRSRDYRAAADLFKRAARWHAYPALPYFNLCATQIDMGELTAAVESCGRAIAADPTFADAYYGKAVALAATSAGHNKFPSTDALAALKKYLELAPEGVYVIDARSLLSELSQN